jgi:peptidoglycan/xylan/chitin deacetylase (PgdA/CDA1 family)
MNEPVEMAAGVQRAVPFSGAVRRVPILSYHAIIEEGVLLPSGSSKFHAVSARTFRTQLDILAAEGWNVVLPCALRLPSIPPRCVVITFDDGYASHLMAANELYKRGLTATFFVTWSRLGCEGFLTRPQVACLHRDGFGIGSHGLNHVPLAELAPQQARRQLISSRARLQELLGAPVRTLAAPYGSHNGQVVKAAMAAGYQSMMISRFGVAMAGSYVLPRLTVCSRTSLTDFRALLTGGVCAIARQRLVNSTMRRIMQFWSNSGRERAAQRPKDCPAD